MSSPTDAPVATETTVASPDSIPDRTDLRSVVDDGLRDQVRAPGGDVPVESLDDLAGLGGESTADRTEHLAGIDVDPHSLDSVLQDMREGTSFGGTIDGRTHDLGIGGGTNDAPLLDIEGSTGDGAPATDEYGNELVDGIGPFQYYDVDDNVTREGVEAGYMNPMVLFEKSGNPTAELIGNFADKDGALLAESWGEVPVAAEPQTKDPDEDNYVIIIEEEDTGTTETTSTEGGTAEGGRTDGSPTEDHVEGTNSPTPRTPGSTPTDAIDRSIDLGLANAAPGSGTTDPDPMGENYVAVDGPPSGDQPSVVDPGDDGFESTSLERDDARSMLDDERLPDEEFFDI